MYAIKSNYFATLVPSCIVAHAFKKTEERKERREERERRKERRKRKRRREKGDVSIWSISANANVERV
jgi:hypothetical protein